MPSSPLGSLCALALTMFIVLIQNDPGLSSTTGLGNHFTTFMKARIFCEREVPPGRQFAGSVDYNYNEISEFTTGMCPDDQSGG